MRQPRIAAILVGLLVGLAANRATAQEPPKYWNPRERLPAAKTDSIARLRFLTTVDFPPFNFFDRNGRLTGFHVDLAAAICRELGITEKCQIQALPWEELPEALSARRGDAIIAGLSVTQETRTDYVFTRPYFMFAARLVVPRGNKAIGEPLYDKLTAKRIGVLRGSAHERMLRSYFPRSKAVVFSREDWMYDSLLSETIDGVFGDGMRLSFWISGSKSGNCCEFAGGAYYAPELLGNGLAIAVERGDTRLATALNQALRAIEAQGMIGELYLRYFPIVFY